MEEPSFINIQTNAPWHLQKQEWHLSASFNTFLPHREGQRGAHQLDPKSNLQQESISSVGADFDASISENILPSLFSELFPHPKGARKLASGHREGKPCRPGSAGAGSKGDIHSPVKVSSSPSI